MIVHRIGAAGRSPNGAEEIRAPERDAGKPCEIGIIRKVAMIFTDRLMASFTTPLGPFLKPAGLSWRVRSWEF
jgi:hypothetical protein